MRNVKWIALILALSLLLLVGCAPGEEVPVGSDDQAVQGDQNDSKDWEELLTYAEYLEKSKEEQDAFYASFEDPMEFFEWFDAVKAIYDEERKENEFDGGAIDIGGMSGN